MTGTWDVSALPSSASTTPTLHNRRRQQYQPRSTSGHTKPHSREQSNTPFPRKSASSEGLRDGDIDQAQPPAPTQRTVRRKKSSLDLRDIFLNGGVSSGP
ncbi:hypothetical protein C8Q74DRAFT_1193495 [Fomes fomentarius]|nr:hypothetical protein C8Q74DRAFT_1193495 [Fomes fomentarius]